MPIIIMVGWRIEFNLPSRLSPAEEKLQPNRHEAPHPGGRSGGSNTVVVIGVDEERRHKDDAKIDS